jgi:hypothetical protein
MAKAFGVQEATIGQISSAEKAGVYFGPALGTDPAQDVQAQDSTGAPQGSTG